MPITSTTGLRGLPGLNNVNEEERNAFMLANEDKLKQYAHNPRSKKQAAEVLYNNQQFIKQFGQEAFDANNDGTQAAYEQRNALLRQKVVDDAFKSAYSPFDSNGKRDNNKGMGSNWENYYYDLSTDAKEKLLQSDWKTPEQLAQEQEGRTKWWQKAVDFVAGEAVQQYKQEANQKIIDKIYNDDAEQVAKRPDVAAQIGIAYNDENVIGHTNDETVKKFMTAIKPSETNTGIAEYASHVLEPEMRNFSVDDMREVLAKKYVYEQNMSPQMASTALNNEAKRYLRAQQGTARRLGLFARDVGISSLSYTADKVNGIYNLGLWAADKLGDKPEVLVDDKGNVLDPKTPLISDGKGGFVHEGEDGKMHAVHREAIDRTTLHNMDRNMDGSKDESILNAQYWTRAEQFGTLNEDAQKRYEQIGSSPYKVVYNPNEDSDLWYESFKMMSFGLADAVSMFIPYGIGTAGKALSMANKVGKVGRGLGKAMNYTGKALSAQTKTGQILQGGAGALGIAYAYNRGAFQETLAKNLANTEEAVLSKGKDDVKTLYDNDEAYRSQVDSLVDVRAAQMKADYLTAAKESGAQIMDDKLFDEGIRQRAQEAVLNELVQKRVTEIKSSDEFAQLQQQAIDEAGDAAFNSFLPEAIKYGLVNTLGYRKWMYTNPTGIKTSLSSALKGMGEVTTAGGKQRLAAGATKFATLKDKATQFGKIALSQGWGGAWTNGTDDMMVDAAERMSDDSFNRYLNAYKNGESIADTYNLADGIYSYWQGLRNSLGQETTREAALVGGLGSWVSFTPNMANIAQLATKEGREAYKNNFKQRYVYDTDANGFKTIKRDDSGKPVIEEISALENWRDRANYFIQNGVLNTYYGAKQNERDQQSHADFVNQILDSYEDFRAIGELINADRAREDAENTGDSKTTTFLNALHAIGVLESLANNTDEAGALSSIVQKQMALVRTASQLADGEDVSEDDIKTMLGEYYSVNSEIPRDEENSRIALQNIAKNAKKLMEASKAYTEAEQEVQKIESKMEMPLAPVVREKLKINHALIGHWEERRDQMRDVIGDSSNENAELSGDDLILSYGGKKGAESLVKVYDRQEEEIKAEIAEHDKKLQDIQKKYEDAVIDRMNAKDSNSRYDTQQRLDVVNAALENAKEERKMLDDILFATQQKKEKITSAIEGFDKETSKKLLTAEDIFALDPVSRARIMHKGNRSLYSKKQQAEIEKLEKDLLKTDADALDKIQDIALLTQRIATAKDSYSRIAQNPEAAAYAFEQQRIESADAAFALTTQRNAEITSEFVAQFNDAMAAHADVDSNFKESFVFNVLKKLNDKVLTAIDKNGLVPKYNKQLQDAIGWGKLTADIGAVINGLDGTQEWKDNLDKNIQEITHAATNKETMIAALEKAIDDIDNVQVTSGIEKVLKGLEELGHQRDAAVVESREKRKQREAEAKKKEAEAKKKLDESAQAAAAKAQAEAMDKKLAEEAKVDKEIPAKNDAVASEREDVNLVDESGQSIWNVAASTLMEPNAEDSVIEVGEIWTDLNNHPAKKPFVVKLSVDDKTGNRTITFSAFNKAESIFIAPEDWVLEGSEVPEGVDKNTSFTVNSIEKVGGNWQFNGTFAGHKESSTVKVSNQFNLTNAINSEKLDREAVLAERGIVANTEHVEELGDNIAGRVATIDEQIEEAGADNEWHSSDDNAAPDLGNQAGEQQLEVSSTTLSANPIGAWKMEPLTTEGVMEHQEGADPNDAMNRYFKWMDAAGIKLQNIIDDELSAILARNPHAKVKFMTVRPEYNATNDVDMKTHLLLVLDYDDSINKGITRAHNTDLGGVVESDGKKYLIIGVAGYGDKKSAEKNGRLDLYDVLTNSHKGEGYGLVKRGQKEFFDTHLSDRFYVNPNLETEIVPNSLIPGYIVKRMEGDKVEKERSLSELVEDKERNPHNLSLRSLQFGIQEVTKFASPVEPNKVMVPRNAEANAGRAFLLIPAANGKMVPAYMNPVLFQEMREGALQRRIEGYLNALTSPVYTDRYKAMIELYRIFYFDTQNGNGILLGKKNPTVTLLQDGKPMRNGIFTLNSEFNRQQFLDKFAEMNPRINVTVSVLKNDVLKQEYDEAGCFTTDCARLGTAGATYRIYGLDNSGNMLVAGTAENAVPNVGYNSNYRKNTIEVIYGSQRYKYDTKEGTYQINSKIITEESLIKELDYNRIVVENKLNPVEVEGVWEYYILSSGEKPEVIKRNKNTKKIVVADEKQAKATIDKIEAKKEKAARIAAAKEPKNLVDVSLLPEAEFEVNAETGEAAPEEENAKREKKEKKAPVKQQGPTDFIHKDVAKNKDSEGDNGTQNFNTLIKQAEHTRSIITAIKTKWPEAPTNIEALTEFLRKKNVEVDTIGTTEEDINAWISTIEDCR